MDTFPSYSSNRAEEMPQQDYTSSKSNETTPLLANCADGTESAEEKWKPGPGFIWIQIGTTRQAYCYVLNTDTGSYLLERVSFGV